MPQKRISICTSFSVGSRRAIVVEASGDVALAAENAFALYISSLLMHDAWDDMQNTPFSIPNEDTEETAVPAFKPKEYSRSSPSRTDRLALRSIPQVIELAFSI